MANPDQPRSDQGPAGETPSPAAAVSARPARRRPRSNPKRLAETAGPSPDAALDSVRLTVGVIAGTHGVHGELKLKVLTDHPEHLPTLRKVYLGDSETPTSVLGLRFQGEQALITLEGVESPEEGKRLGGLKVRIAGSDAKPLEEGEYFLFQLIGLTAADEHGTGLGTVTDLLETGAHDVLVITGADGQDLLVPNHPQFVLDVDPERGRIVLRPPVYPD